MALGKAFIEVHADTRPFARELAAELNKIVSTSEKEVRVSARKLGSGIAEDTGNGIRRNRNSIRNGLNDALTQGATGALGAFSRFSKGIIDTIDDGISGLPDEVKVILGAALVATLPVAVAVGSALAAAVVSGFTLGGLTAIGTLLAFQFKEVREAGLTFVADIRDIALQAGRFLAGPVISSLDLIRNRLTNLSDDLAVVFADAGRVIVPVVDAALGAFEQFLPGFKNGLKDIERFLLPLQVGFRLIGRAAGQFFDTILNNDDAPEALYDLLIFVEDLIQFFTALVDIGLDFYGTLRDIFEFLGIVEESGDDLAKFAKEFNLAEGGATGFKRAIEGTIEPLESETEQVEALNKAISDYTKLVLSSLDNQIAWEQGLDDLSDSIKENGRSLDITKQAGRDNAQALINLAEVALRTRADTIALTGEVDNAQNAFERQRAKIYEVAAQMGLSKQRTEELVGALLRIPAPKSTGVTDSAVGRLEEFNRALREAIYLSNLFDPNFNPRGPGGQQKYADGGIVTGPTSALIGEAGPEVVIPLTRPGRAQELLNASGLSAMTGPTVNVYIGNDQIDAYIDARQVRNNTMTARSLAYGSRGI